MVWLLLLGLCLVQGAELERARAVGARSFYIMGTRATIEVEAEPRLVEQVLEAAYAELERVDELMSSYRPESEVCRINRLAAVAPVSVSPMTARVLEEALRIGEVSEGAYDPTVGPLRRLWMLDSPAERFPSPADVRSALRRMGFRHVVLDVSRGRVGLARKGMELDLGGIAKGWAVDRAVGVLRRAGADYGFVDLGQSSIGVFGRRLTFWIRHPMEPGEAVAAFTLDEGSISTSAAYERGVAWKRGVTSHIVDPRDGMPVEQSLSATVIGREGEAMKVDALSTAGFVLGPRRALELWQREGVEGILFYASGEGLDFAATPGFPLR